MVKRFPAMEGQRKRAGRGDMTLMARTTASAQQCKNRSGANTQKERKGWAETTRTSLYRYLCQSSGAPFFFGGGGGSIVARAQAKRVGAFSSVKGSTLDYISAALRPTAEAVAWCHCAPSSPPTSSIRSQTPWVYKRRSTALHAYSRKGHLIKRAGSVDSSGTLRRG